MLEVKWPKMQKWPVPTGAILHLHSSPGPTKKLDPYKFYFCCFNLRNEHSSLQHCTTHLFSLSLSFTCSSFKSLITSFMSVHQLLTLVPSEWLVNYVLKHSPTKVITIKSTVKPRTERNCLVHFKVTFIGARKKRQTNFARRWSLTWVRQSESQ